MTPAQIERLRKIGTAALKAYRRRATEEHFCHAKARTTGKRCGNFAVSGRRVCHLHGGRTPRGDGWHRRQWPKPSDPRAMEKIDAKLRRVAGDAKKHDARLASLSPKMRSRYAAWVRAHKPGPIGDRYRARIDRAAAATVRELRTRPKTDDPEVEAINRRIAKLEAALDAKRRDETATTLPDFFA